MPDAIPCKVCDRGVLARKKIHRMSGPVVAIGYILLIPSVLGVLLSIGAFLTMSVVSGTSSNQTRRSAIAEMRQHYVPEQVIQQVVANPDMDISQFILRDDMSMATYSWLKDADQKLKDDEEATGAGMVVGGGIFIAIGILCFVSGLLGWLLVMKKRVLQCSSCQAVVNAS